MAAGITSDNFKQSTDVLLNVLIDQKLVFFKYFFLTTTCVLM